MKFQYFIIAALLAFAGTFTSCTKVYFCTCNSSTGFDLFEYREVKKEDARIGCESRIVQDSTYTSCSL